MAKINSTEGSELRITLSDVSVHIPLFEHGLSFKKALLTPFINARGKDRKDIPDKVEALKHVSIDIRQGDRIGMIGPNGSGKTTLLRLLAGSYFPTGGDMTIHGKVTAILNVGIGMDPDMSGYDNIETCGLLLGWAKSDIHAKRDEIAEFSGIGHFIDMPIRTYSAGMLLRLSFAIATAFDPEILLIDEIIGVGDAVFASKAKARIDRLIEDARILIIASHDDGIIRQFCNRVIFMANGVVQYDGPTEEGLKAYADWQAAQTTPPTVEDGPAPIAPEAVPPAV